MNADTSLSIFLKAKKAALGKLPASQENELNAIQGGESNGFQSISK